jgi:YggT family protein
MLADAISQVAVFIGVFASVYTLTLIAYVITSWIKLPYSLNAVQRFLHDVCEPYLRLWRRVLPFSAGPMDFSPIIAIIALGLVARLVIALLERLH